MVKLSIEKGRKAPEDRIVRLWSYGEILTFEEILRILDVIFKSEDSIYPISEGFKGKTMLMKAILEVYSGVPLERVLRDYGLERKGKSVKVIEKIHEVM